MSSSESDQEVENINESKLMTVDEETDDSTNSDSSWWDKIAKDTCQSNSKLD